MIHYAKYPGYLGTTACGLAIDHRWNVGSTLATFTPYPESFTVVPEETSVECTACKKTQLFIQDQYFFEIGCDGNSETFYKQKQLELKDSQTLTESERQFLAHFEGLL